MFSISLIKRSNSVNNSDKCKYKFKRNFSDLSVNFKLNGSKKQVKICHDTSNHAVKDINLWDLLQNEELIITS